MAIPALILSLDHAKNKICVVPFARQNNFPVVRLQNHMSELVDVSQIAIESNGDKPATIS
jgi:hypothetical protein